VEDGDTRPRNPNALTDITQAKLKSKNHTWLKKNQEINKKNTQINIKTKKFKNKTLTKTNKKYNWKGRSVELGVNL